MGPGVSENATFCIKKATKQATGGGRAAVMPRECPVKAKVVEKLIRKGEK